MSQLNQLQSLFMDAVFDGPENNPAIAQLSQYLTDKPQLTAEQQIAIYRDSVLGGMTSALNQIYPVCNKLVGDEFFDFMAAQFIYRSESLSPDLGDYGERFADFIADFKPAAELVYLADVARLEWAWHQAFNAADSQGLNIHQLSQLNDEQQSQLMFKLPPGSSLIHSDFPINKIWQVNQDDYIGDDTINLDDGAVMLFVWRQGYTMRIDSISDDQWLFLSALKNNQSLVDICSYFADNTAVNIEALMPVCVQQGWIADFTFSP